MNWIFTPVFFSSDGAGLGEDDAGESAVVPDTTGAAVAETAAAARGEGLLSCASAEIPLNSTTPINPRPRSAKICENLRIKSRLT